MAEARPVTDVVVERFIIVIVVSYFLARRDRGSGDRLRGRVSEVSARLTCERVCRSNRVVASDWLLIEYRCRGAIRQMARWSRPSFSAMIAVSSSNVG